MGIPAYYSYLIKNHPEILESLSSADHFYLDCNSIIYDVVNQFSFKLGTMSENEDEIILLVIQKIEEYISLINPRTVTITFDGIAPFAKLCQQRERRFKSYYQNKIKKKIKNVSAFWDSAKITPGTAFMKCLTKKVNDHFDGRGYYIFACDVPGEGEHKLFEVLRCRQNDKHVIYGLDSDLIMLGMLHLDISSNIFLYRETPVYIKNINSTLDENQEYLLNLNLLSQIISKEMRVEEEIARVDYIFISFLMGNDFMPHFPSLNIRTGGIDKIISAYRSNPNQIITINRSKKEIIINWKNFHLFLSTIREKEDEYIKTEYKIRERKRFNGTEKWQRFENTPSIDREIEIYINPNKSGWEERYYDSLFDKICDPRDYINGLVWNMTYYVFGCNDYHWHYPYHYPPLVKDLLSCIPLENQHIIWEKMENDITDIEQLCYVLPICSLHILPDDIRSKLKKKWYVDDCAFSWAFCKYFWESHADLPEIDFMELRKCLSIK